ncbi:MFS transporter [Oscillospiraceae bacterium MB08-C2-2]|nr:MFS transporter [Oscillospiraceae bacterium MB08-C2-2]
MNSVSNKLHHGWIVLISCCFIMFGTLGIIANCMSVFIAQVNADMGFEMTYLVLYFTFMTITLALFQPVAQKIFQKLNVKLVGAIAVILPAVGMSLMTVYTSVEGFYLSGVINGIGLSFITYLLIPTLMNKWFAVKLGLVMGIAMACSNLGGAVFSPIAGKLIATMGWRPACLLLAGLSVVISLPFALFGITRDPKEKGLEPYGADQVSKAGNTQQLTGLTLKEAAKTPWLYLVFVSVIGMFFFANFQPQIVKFATTTGFPIEKAAVVGSMLMIGSVVGKVGLGYINDKLGTIACVTIGGGCGIAGLLLFIMGSEPKAVFIGAVLFGIGFAMMSIVPPLLVRKSMGSLHFAAIFSVVASVGTVTSAISNPIYGAIYEGNGTYVPGLIAAAISMGVVILCGIVIGGRKAASK